MIFDVAKGMVCKVLFAKLVFIDSDLRLYMSALLVAVL